MASLLEQIDAGLLRAQEVLAQVGQTITLRTISTVLRDASEPWQGTVDVPVDTDLKAGVSKYSLKDVDRGSLREGDVQCIMLVLDLGAVVPTTTGQVIWEGTTYGINKVDPIFAGDVAVAYEARLRS